MNNNSPNSAEWFEIPTADIHKAVSFYNQVLGLELEAQPHGPNVLAIFPHRDPAPGGCLMQGPDMVPSGAGSVVYLSAKNIDHALTQVVAAGGTVSVPKTPIGPDMGFFARFRDLEGNLVGLAGQA